MKIVFTFMLIPFLVFTQEKIISIDSVFIRLNKSKNKIVIVDTLLNLSRKNRVINLEASYFYANKAFQISKEINYKNGLAKSTASLGKLASIKSENNLALELFNKAKSYTNDKRITAGININESVVFTDLGNYTKAMECCLNSLKLSEEINDYDSQSIALMNIATLHLYNRDSEKYKLYKQKSLDVVKNKNVLAETGVIVEGKSNKECFIETKNVAEATNYYESKANSFAMQKNVTEKTRFLIMSAIVNINAHHFNRAEKELLDAKQLLNKGANLEMKLLLNYNFGNMYLVKYEFETKKTDYLNKAENYLNYCYINYSKTKHLIQLKNSSHKLSEIFNYKNNKTKQLFYLNETLRLERLIFNSKNKETIKNLEDKREIELRDKEIKINKLSLQAKEKQKWFYILGLGFLGILGGLLFYQSYNRKKVNEKLKVLNSNLDQANKTKARFFSILNHDLRGPVSNLIGFLHLQKENPELLDEQSKLRLQNKTISGAENLLNSMEDILLWSKGQMENFKPQPKKISVETLFEDAKKHFESEEKVKIIFENNQNIEINTDENYLKTIIRNLTGNAIKALSNIENATINWKAWQDNNQTFFSISDNGNGVSNNELKALYDENEVVGIKTGLGLHLIRDLAKAINCEINVNSKLNYGTTFTLKL